MIILTIIVGVLALGLLVSGGIASATTYYGAYRILGGIGLGIVWFTLFLFILNVKLSSETLTGYVYSKDNFGGVNTYHIRFSETAGADVQPSFCVNDDSPNAKDIDEVVGTGKKVTVNIPSTGVYFSNDLWHCESNAQLVEEGR